MAEPSWICCVSACFAGGEGSLRTPCIVRWSGRVVAGQASDDIMHVTGWFTTILHAAGLTEPTDRISDPFRHADVLSSCQKDRTVIDSFGNHGKRMGIKLGRPRGVGKSKLDDFRPEIEALPAVKSRQKFIANRYGTTEANLSRWIERHGLRNITSK